MMFEPLVQEMTGVSLDHPPPPPPPPSQPGCHLKPKFANLNQIRELEFVSDKMKNCVVDPSMLLSVCSYNVLSEFLHLKHDHLYMQPNQVKCIEWAHRWPRIVEQLLRLHADIYCLQEVDTELFNHFFQPLFNAGGYECVFSQRNGSYKDGLVLAYRTTKFYNYYFETIYFNYHVPGFNRDNAAQVILLQDLITQRFVIVSNTHMCEDTKAADIKIGQVALLLATIDKFLFTVNTNNLFCGIFMCGTFGFEPNSALYNFVCNGLLDLKQVELRSVALAPNPVMRKPQNLSWYNLYHIQPEVRLYYKTCTFLEPSVQATLRVVDELNHPRRFLSAYTHFNKVKHPEVSMYNNYACNPDFIFYSGLGRYEVQEHRIYLRRRFTLPSQTELHAACGPMPNIQSGSDHLPLFAEFVLN